MEYDASQRHKCRQDDQQIHKRRTAPKLEQTLSEDCVRADGAGHALCPRARRPRFSSSGLLPGDSARSPVSSMARDHTTIQTDRGSPDLSSALVVVGEKTYPKQLALLVDGPYLGRINNSDRYRQYCAKCMQHSTFRTSILRDAFPSPCLEHFVFPPPPYRLFRAPEISTTDRQTNFGELLQSLAGRLCVHCRTDTNAVPVLAAAEVTRSKMKPSMKVKSIGTCIALLLFGVGAIYGSPFDSLFCWTEYLPSVDNIPFDSKVWKSKSAKRLAMAQDLCQKETLDRLSEAEVVKLLGAPDANGSHCLQNEKVLCYYMIPARKGDSSTLIITLMDDAVVDNYIKNDYQNFYIPKAPYLYLK